MKNGESEGIEQAKTVPESALAINMPERSIARTMPEESLAISVPEGYLAISVPEIQDRLGKVLAKKKARGKDSFEFIRFLYALRSEPIENTKLLRKSDICEVFGLTPPALKMRLKRAPESLPKPFTFPGSKIQYWTAKSVSEFIEKHSGVVFEPTPEPEKTGPTEIKRKRGRPSYVSTGKRVPVTE